jgi:hypothetical protein
MSDFTHASTPQHGRDVGLLGPDDPRAALLTTT